jgi:molybdopterin-guanine dinucleotide biosynthesis protein A
MVGLNMIHMPSKSVGAILIAGGASSRFGTDKTQVIVEGTTIAIRTAKLLSRVVETAIEVGPGVSGLPCTLEDPPGAGPLAAIAAGATELARRHHTGSALVLACDLPFLTEQLLNFLIEFDAPGTVVPVVQGQLQPLCARWSHRDLRHAEQLLKNGNQSLRHLSSQDDVVRLHESDWQHVASEKQFFDIDCPEDLHRLGNV